MSNKRADMRRSTRVWTLGLLLAAFSFTGTVMAAERLTLDRSTEVTPTDSENRRGPDRLERSRLVPRVKMQMEALSAFHRSAAPGLKMQDHVMFQEMTASVQRGAERAARRAARDYLLERLNLESGLDSLRPERSASAETRSGLKFQFGVHSLMPQVGVKYRVGQGSLRLRIDGDGEIALRFRSDLLERADFSAGFDGENTFKIGARLGF